MDESYIGTPKFEIKYADLDDLSKIFENFKSNETENLDLNSRHFLTILLKNCSAIYTQLNRSLSGCNAQFSKTGKHNISIVRLNPRRDLGKHSDEWAPKLKITIGNFISKHLCQKSVHYNADVDLDSFGKANVNDLAIVKLGSLIVVIGFNAAVQRVFKQVEEVLSGKPITNAAGSIKFQNFKNSAKIGENVKEFISYIGESKVNLRLNKFQSSFLRNSSKILEDFQFDLQSVNAKLNLDKLIIETEYDEINLDNWSNLVCSKVEDYFINSIKFKTIPVPKFFTEIVELKQKIDEFLKTNKATSIVYYELNTSFVKFGAYREMASKLNPFIRKKFARVERNLYNKNNPILCIELNEIDEPKINLFFYRKDDFYFNLFKNKIENFDTSCMKIDGNKIKIVNTLIDANSKKIDSKIVEWREKINRMSKQFFNQYHTTKFDIPTKWTNDSKTNFHDLFVDVCYTDFSISVIGPKKLLNAFVKLNKE